MPPTRPDRSCLVDLCVPALDRLTPDLLHKVDRALAQSGAASLRDDVQIVLAEAINNIVEHAYAGPGFGTVTLRVTLTRTSLCLHLTDWGNPFSEGANPAGQVPDPQAQSEGGYGWFLIRALASRTRHARTAGQNHLCLLFRIP
ncbi:MAG: ATP-binding protein [Pelagibaca sp.]